jgi:hypothetical protein
MDLDKESKKWLKRAVDGSGEKIEKSAIFASLYSGGYHKDPLCALQLGIAIMLDKPICLIAIDGQPIPKHLEKIAFAIERVNDPSEAAMRDAMTRIMLRADELGF